MQHVGAHDKAWTKLKMGELEGAYRVEDGRVHVVYEGRETTVEAGAFVPPLADAAAEGIARIALAELIGR